MGLSKIMGDNKMLLITLATLFSAVHVCALENLALNKSTWQKNPWPDLSRDFGSENAVDGLYTDRGIGGQCTISDDGQYTAEWRVDLGSVVSVSYINIFYRTDIQNPRPFVNRMAGFSLYVSNTTYKKQGHLCYKDQSRGNPSVDQTINCTTFGRYVIYYNNRSVHDNPSYLSPYAYNELCEVEVYGCRWYDVTGDGCRDQCPKHCLNEDCDINTGQCRSCLSGYQGERCTEECQHGYYGRNCLSICNTNCNVRSSCDKVSGKCIGYCKPGWFGEMCDQECQQGFYGTNCSNGCNANCNVASICDKVSGKCTGGCRPGWFGDMCDLACPSGFFGSNCSNRCDTYCSGNKSCDPVMGICTEGCIKGWSGLMCGLDRFCSRQPCDNTTPTIIGVILSVAIVFSGSVINLILWRKKKAESELQRHYETTGKNKDKSGDTSQQYTELREVNKSSCYDDINSYSN